MQTLSLRRRVLAVLSGGFCGTLTRYFVSLLVQSYLGKGWPYDILLINISGALLLAFLTTLADATVLIGPTRRLFLNVGFLGAYTTFSSLALGADQLLLKGLWFPGTLYLLLSLLGGIGAVLLGDWLAQLLLVRIRPDKFEKKALALPVLHEEENASEAHVDVEDDVVTP